MTKQTIRTLAAHPLADEYPMMPQAELDRMAASMKLHGYDARFPVVVWEGKILDGRNRHAAAKAAGVVPTYLDFAGDRGAAERFVQAANEARRHLDRAWLEKRRDDRVKRVAELRGQGKSTRAIAEAEKISPAQVQRDLEKAGVKPAPAAIEGRDGRTYTPPPKPTVPYGTVAPSPAAKKAGKPPKSGSVLYDYSGFESAYGVLVREIDKLGNAYQERDTPEAEGLRRRLAEFHKAFKEFHGRVTRKK